MFLREYPMESAIFFLINKGCKVSCVKIFFLSTVNQKGTNILFFKHNFEFIM